MPYKFLNAPVLEVAAQNQEKQILSSVRELGLSWTLQTAVAFSGRAKAEPVPTNSASTQQTFAKS